MAQDRTQLALIEKLQDPGGTTDRRIPRVATRRKRVRTGGIADEEPGHGLVCCSGQLAHHRIDLRSLNLGDRLGLHGFQRQLIAVEIDVHIHTHGHQHG